MDYRNDSRKWSFIMFNLPNYYSRDDVLRNDILCRFIENEEVSEKDQIWIQDEFNSNIETIKQECIRLENKFLLEALDNYYNN